VILIEMTTKNIMPPDLTFGGLWETVVESWNGQTGQPGTSG
jgi:hypothetical protein